ncbi:hypothetical protein EPN42_09345 [bacterium]|nr:MAG: hypothetical protein EPN42_09345 [bacterium]
MKRLLVVAALLALVATFTTSAVNAAPAPLYGSVQLNWNVTVASSMTLVTDYSNTGAQGTVIPTLAAAPAGTCTGGGAETAFNVTFGQLTPSLSASVACLYPSAVLVGVNTNDASGYAVNEALDAAPAGGASICAAPNSASAFPLTPSAAVTTSTRTSASLTSGATTCGTLVTNGSALAVGNGTATVNGTGGPGNPGSANLSFNSGFTNGLKIASAAGSTGGAVNYVGEDLAVLLPAGASSVASPNNDILTIQLVPN